MFDRPDARDGNRDLWVAELRRGVVAPLTSNPGNDWFPVWSADGKRVLFASDRGASANLASYIKTSIEPDAEETPTNFPKDPFDWSSDGNWIAFGTNDILIGSAKDSHVFSYLATPFSEGGARFSPDSRWIAYSSNESGRSEVYIRPFHGGPAGPGNIQVSINGGDFPIWRKDGRELFFMSADNGLYSVDLSNLGSTNTIASPIKLFRACPATRPSETAGSNARYFYTFDTHDGNRFLLDCRVKPTGQFLVLVDPLTQD